MMEVFFINVSTPREPLNLELPDVGKVWFGPARYSPTASVVHFP